MAAGPSASSTATHPKAVCSDIFALFYAARPADTLGPFSRYLLSFTASRSRTPRPPAGLGAPSLINSMPASCRAPTSFINEATVPRMTPSLASILWMVGTERLASSANSRWSTSRSARAALSWVAVIMKLLVRRFCDSNAPHELPFYTSHWMCQPSLVAEGCKCGYDRAARLRPQTLGGEHD